MFFPYNNYMIEPKAIKNYFMTFVWKMTFQRNVLIVLLSCRSCEDLHKLTY